MKKSLLSISSLLLLALIGFRYITDLDKTPHASPGVAGVNTDTTSVSSTGKGLPEKQNVESKRYSNLEIPDVPSPLKSQIKSYSGFTLSFNPDNRTPNWVGWELLASETDGQQSRSNKFWQDESLRNCPTSEDYSRSGYDRGHMCPAADQKWSAQAMADCFVMANMCPQDHALNAGAWQTLEKKERAWAKRDGAIVIVAGPIYESSDKKRINGIRVPSAFFKVLCAPYIDEPRAIAFVYPNMTSPGNMEQYAMSVDEVEKITGFDFFPTLPDKLENEIESKYSFREWNR